MNNQTLSILLLVAGVVCVGLCSFALRKTFGSSAVTPAIKIVVFVGVTALAFGALFSLIAGSCGLMGVKLL